MPNSIHCCHAKYRSLTLHQHSPPFLLFATQTQLPSHWRRAVTRTRFRRSFVNKLRLCLRLKTSSQINISQERTRRWLSFSWASNTETHSKHPLPLQNSHSSFCARRAVDGCYATSLQNRCLGTWRDSEIKEAINPIMHWEEVKRQTGEDEIAGTYLPLCLTSCLASTCNHSTQRWRFYFNVHPCNIKSNASL